MKGDGNGGISEAKSHLQTAFAVQQHERAGQTQHRPEATFRSCKQKKHCQQAEHGMDEAIENDIAGNAPL
jgi:hypothetical protein